MHELTESELYPDIQYAQSIDEDAGREILNQFHLDQPELADALFGFFPTALAEENKEMSYLFLELCFDILCIFQFTFDPVPLHDQMDKEWLEKQSVLLNAELQAIAPGISMDKRLRNKLQDRLTQRIIDEYPQRFLTQVISETVDQYSSESLNRLSYTKMTQTLLFFVVRLFCNLYQHGEHAK